MRILRRCVAVFVILAPVVVHAQSAEPDVGRAVSLADTLEALERASWVAWQQRDSTFFSRFLTTDHVEVGANGPISRAAVLAGVASPACVVRGYQLDAFRTTRLDAHTAILTYHAAQDTRCGTAAVPSPAWATSLYVWRDGRWQNALYQQTPTPRPTSP